MRHQPFEAWILDDESITPEQAVSLREHLETCEECRLFQQRWLSLRKEILDVRMVAPAPGFTHRWKDTLGERRIRQQKLQTRRFLLTLSGATLASLVSLVIYLLVTTTPAALIVNLFQSFTQLAVRWNDTKAFFIPFLDALPPAIPIAAWVLLTTGLSILTFIWAGSLWRIATQGVNNK